MKNTSEVATAPKTNNIGSAILALSGMVSRTWGKTPSSKQIACTIALEKAGVIRPVADQVRSGLALTEKAYHTYKTMADAGEEGAAKVIKIAEELRARGIAIKAYKATKAAADEPAAAPAG